MKKRYSSSLLLVLLLLLTVVIGIIYVLLPSGVPHKQLVLGSQSSQLQTIAAVTNQDHIKGNPNAKITVIEYSNFECPSCIQFQPTIKQVMQTYGKNIRWIVRNFYLTQYINSEKEAEASECANELGESSAYWKYSDLIFNRTTGEGTGFPLSGLVPLAQEIGLDKTQFKKCLDSSKYAKHIANNTTEATLAGIHQFPSTVIIDQQGNRQLLVGPQPFSVFQAILDNALAQ